MSKIAVSTLAVACLGASAPWAQAQCSFNITPAKGLTTSMVRAYTPCPSTPFSSPNTSTQTALPSCAPVIPSRGYPDGYPATTLYSYGPKGKCSVQASARVISDCADLEGDPDGDGTDANLGLAQGPCHVTFVKSKCTGILDTSGDALIDEDDDGWVLRTLTRATLDDAGAGDVTVIDFPVSFLYSTPGKGAMEIDSSSAEALVAILGPSAADLPACTQLELVNLLVVDPEGLPFARMGSATVPK